MSAALGLTGPAGLVRAQERVPVYGAVDGSDSIILSNADGRNAYSGVVR
jgi:hypothetical protein